TSPIRIGINGFGRIGRAILRVVSAETTRSGTADRADLEVVAINDLYPTPALAYLFQYDTVMGVFDGDIRSDDRSLPVNGKRTATSTEKPPGAIPCRDLGVEIVVESTGVSRTRESLEPHLAAGAGRVVLTVPAKDEIDAMIVMGVNDDALRPEHRIVS